MPERLEVQRTVAASAGEIFAVLTDPRGHVAIDSSGMLMEASGDIVAKVGDTFVVHMDREALNDYPLGLYDVTVEIVTFEPDRGLRPVPAHRLARAGLDRVRERDGDRLARSDTARQQFRCYLPAG
jgi:hypothetical protein